MIDTGKPVLICLGLPLSLNVLKADANAANGSIIRDRNKRVGIGAAVALFRFGALFDRLHVPSQLRLSTATSFADLHHYPTVLLGAFSNQFTLDVVDHLRYRFEHSEIVDSKTPGSIWRATLDDKSDLLSDYGIAARLMENESHKPMIIAAGIEHCGTGAASELFSDDLTQLVDRLPPGWQHKNFEALVSVRVVDHSCGAPEIIRLEVW